MRRTICLLTLLLLVFASSAYATNFSALEVDFAQGGNPTKTRAIIGSGQLYTGPCRILSVNYFSATAGDLVGIYNTVDSRYPITALEFEMGISANNTNAPPYYPNAPFDNGIRVLSTSGTSVTTVVFDY